MEIDVWGGDWGLPSVEFNSLQLITLVKFSGAQAQINKTNNPFTTADGNLPVFKHNKKKLTKFQDVLGYLNEKNYCPDLNLNAVKLAESKAYRTMIEEKLLPALRYIWWVDNGNYTALTRPWYAKALPFPLNFYYPNRYKQENEHILRSLYPDEEEGSYPNELYKEAERCLTCLSNRLGDSLYFFGEHPSSLDATVYGCLAPLLKAPFPSNVLQNHLKASTNLVRFIVRISQRYFPQDLSDYDTKRQKESEKNLKKPDLFPNKKRNQILAGLFAAIAMLSYGFYNDIISISISNSDSETIHYHKDEEADE